MMRLPGVVAGRAFDHDRTAAKAIACTIARRAAHDDEAAGDALHVAVERGAEKVARVALDLEPAAGQAGPREGSGVAVDGEAPAAHVVAGGVADGALDDDLAALEARAEIVEARRAAFETDRLRPRPS